MTDAVPTADVSRPAARPRWRRWAAVVLVPLALACGWLLYDYRIAAERLREAVAEANRLDPGWRLDDLLAAREPVPDDQNAAQAVLAARALLPWNWGMTREESRLSWDLQHVPRPVQLTAELTARLRAALAPYAEARAQAARLAHLTRGCYSLSRDTYVLGGERTGEMRSFPEFDTNLRPVARLLALEATLRAQDGDLEGALACCQAILNTFASAAEEPSLDAWVYAWASGYEALWQLERILAQGEPPPEALVAVQALLQGQEARPSFLTALSGERARYAAFAEQTGRPDIYGTELTVAGRLRMAARGQLRASVREGSLLLPASLLRLRAAQLRLLTWFVEAAKLPPEEQPARLERFDEFLNKEPEAVRKWLSERAVEHRFRNARELHAALRRAIVAVAAERFRQANRRWPDSPGELVPAFLANVPADGWDGSALCCRRSDGGRGVTVSSVKEPRNAFRLWDVAYRRQPADEGTTRPGGR